MNVETVDVVDNIIQAVSILNKTDDYLESLDNRLSECDSLISDYEHLIENSDLTQINMEKLLKNMQNIFSNRRIIKNNIALRDNYKNLTARLNNNANRQFLIQSMKTTKSKLGTKYHNRILTNEDIQMIMQPDEPKKKRGRPKKEKEGV